MSNKVIRTEADLIELAYRLEGILFKVPDNLLFNVELSPEDYYSLIRDIKFFGQREGAETRSGGFTTIQIMTIRFKLTIKE